MRTQRLTYGELNRRANRLAHYLRGVRGGAGGAGGALRGAEPGDGHCDAGSAQSGWGVCPARPGVPGGAPAYMLTDSAAGVVLTEAGLRRDCHGE